ncbi:MAG: hypothetical protein NZ552_03365 [Planctomycetes bacterium]|nr:hypothetical protein [Planctomycetota bacterium]
MLRMLAWSAAFAAALAAGESPPLPYPLTTCLVSGQELGSMGPPLTVVREGQEIQLCCRGCVRALDRDLPRYLQTLAAARAARAGDATR